MRVSCGKAELSLKVGDLSRNARQSQADYHIVQPVSEMTGPEDRWMEGPGGSWEKLTGLVHQREIFATVTLPGGRFDVEQYIQEHLVSNHPALHFTARSETNAGQITTEKLQRVKVESGVKKLKDMLQGSEVEEKLLQTEIELSLAGKMLQWKPREPLVEESPAKWK
ncbi:hypothetical protein U0070_016426 [Myodes glareolus]|uniref:NADH dehydrogenase [ubiquinone] 1 alpha subcomplex subunit 5 n=1 Tax=Myodes glareolus TaxID=447135 RepID=A0AAW0K010_MYOGA